PDFCYHVSDPLCPFLPTLPPPAAYTFTDYSERHLRTLTACTRPTFRRAVLHRRKDHRHLLPHDLPGDVAEAREHHVLPERRGGQRSGLSPLSPLPARVDRKSVV